MGGRTEAPWSLRQLGAVWYVRFRHAGRRHEYSTGERERAGAEVHAALIFAKVVSGEWQRQERVEASPALPPFSLEDAVDGWISHQESSHDETTCKTWRQYGARWVTFFGDDLHAVDWPRASARYMSERLRVVLAKTVRQELSGLRGLLGWAHDEGHLPELPVVPSVPRKAVGVRAGKQRAKSVHLEPDEIVRWLEAMPAKVRPRYVLMAETGLRPRTLDLLRTPQHYTRGSAVLQITADIDKNRFARTLPLTAAARAVLDARLDELTNEDEGVIFGASRWIASVKKAAVVAKLPRAKEVSPYDLRHGLATHALEASGNLSGVGYLLGHLQATTTNRYLHTTQRAAHEVLAAFRPPVSGEEPGEASLSGQSAPFLSRRRLARKLAIQKRIMSVRRTGLEPVRFYSLVPETSASANSATFAR